LISIQFINKPNEESSMKRKFKGGETVWINEANTREYRVCKKGHMKDSHPRPRTYYKVARGSDIRLVRSDKVHFVD
jgi:hypothetical protein